jgi:hypothetical protein
MGCADPLCIYCRSLFDPETLGHKEPTQDDHWPASITPTQGDPE